MQRSNRCRLTLGSLAIPLIRNANNTHVLNGRVLQQVSLKLSRGHLESLDLHDEMTTASEPPCTRESDTV